MPKFMHNHHAKPGNHECRNYQKDLECTILNGPLRAQVHELYFTASSYHLVDATQEVARRNGITEHGPRTTRLLERVGYCAQKQSPISHCNFRRNIGLLCYANLPGLQR